MPYAIIMSNMLTITGKINNIYLVLFISQLYSALLNTIRSEYAVDQQIIVFTTGHTFMW